MKVKLESKRNCTLHDQNLCIVDLFYQLFMNFNKSGIFK